MRKAAGAGVFALTLAVSLGAVVAALVSQHVFDMQPCPWCVLQRLIFAALALAAVLGLLWTSRVGRRVAASIGVVFAATASCADAAVQLFGVPYEYWSLGLFGALGIALVTALTQRAR